MADRPLALVTGASGGIGLDLARRAAQDGYDLVLTARRREALEAAAGEIASRYRVTTSVIADDLADPSAPARIWAQIDRPVDVLVNNAGFGVFGEFAEQDPADVDGMVQVNVAALTSLTRLALPGMLERGTGGVLNVASVAGFLSGPLLAVYYATKNYVVALTEAIAEENAGSGVTISALCPGPVTTGFQDRAGVQASRMREMSYMDSPTCARIGWEGFRDGRRIIIPGASNQVTVFGPRILPRRLMTKMVLRVQDHVDG
jgi:short-subunit dehydrogenase